MDNRDITIQAELAAELRAALADHDDEDFTLDVVEGETQLFELLDALMADDANDEAHIASIEARVSDLRERKARFQVRRATRKRIVQAALDTSGIRKIERAEYTASLRAVPPGVEITDAAALPIGMVRIKREPDKTAIKKALADGPVSGARLTNGGETVSIRRR